MLRVERCLQAAADHWLQQHYHQCATPIAKPHPEHAVAQALMLVRVTLANTLSGHTFDMPCRQWMARIVWAFMAHGGAYQSPVVAA